MEFYPYEFSGPITRHSMGTNAKGELFYTVVWLPEELEEALPCGG